jgi:hypothetical protein
MSDFRIIDVTSTDELRRFVHFPMDLYRGDRNYVPPLLHDEYVTLKPGSPAQDTCESRLYLAMRNDNVVGRVAAIVNHTANGALNTQNVRFGWFDCVDDAEVAQALLEKASDFGREKGMKTMTGPAGYSRFDKKGLLVAGFEYLPTVATLYNYPYYDGLVKRCGFEKHIDMIEQFLPDMRLLPQRLIRFAELLRKRQSYRVLDLEETKRALQEKKEMMDLMEAVLIEHYDSFPMTPLQRQYCAGKFLPYLNPRLTKIVTNGENRKVAFFVAMPNLSPAFQKANGRLLPVGFFHIWRGMRARNGIIDFCVGGVRKEYRRRGLDVLVGVDLFKSAIEMGFTMAETNPELEVNVEVQREWRDLNPVQRRRRRVYIKSL